LLIYKDLAHQNTANCESRASPQAMVSGEEESTKP
jgi:hypothetical protein